MMRSPCVSLASGATTSYHGSFLVIDNPPAVDVYLRFPPRQIARTHFHLFREKRRLLVFWRENTSPRTLVRIGRFRRGKQLFRAPSACGGWGCLADGQRD